MPYVEFPTDRISELSYLLETRLPGPTVQLYNRILLCLHCKKENLSQYEFTFYWFDELPFHSTSFLSRVRRNDWPGKSYWIFVGPRPNSGYKLPPVISALESLVNWQESNSFNAVDERFVPSLWAMFRKHDPHLLPITFDTVYWTRKKKALQLSMELLDASVEVRELSAKHVEVVARYWKFAVADDIGAIAFGIQVIGSAGLWVGEELVSWAVGMPDGAIHALYTLEGYRGKGYGRMVIKYLCKLLAQRGYFPMVHVEEGNDASTALMTSIGLEVSHYMRWTETKPPKHTANNGTSTIINI